MSYVLTTRNANGFLRVSREYSWDTLTVKEERSQVFAHARYYASKFGKSVTIVDLSDVPECLPGWFDYDVVTCNICDGIGHGYPGAGPCPLEVNERQRAETDYEEAMQNELFN